LVAGPLAGFRLEPVLVRVAIGEFGKMARGSALDGGKTTTQIRGPEPRASARAVSVNRKFECPTSNRCDRPRQLNAHSVSAGWTSESRDGGVEDVATNPEQPSDPRSATSAAVGRRIAAPKR
jgi:hypothetical protein